MKRLGFMVLLFVSMFFISCGDKTVNGFIKEINGDNYVVQTEDGSIINVELKSVDNSAVNNPQICDGLTLDMRGSKVINYTLNPLSKGWVFPLTGTDMFVGVKFFKDGTAEPIGRTLKYVAYERGDGYITVITEVRINNEQQKVLQNWEIKSITRDMLIVNVDGRSRTFKVWDKANMKIKN